MFKLLLISVLVLGATLYAYTAMQVEPQPAINHDYYIREANRYFDTLDFRVWLDPSPVYAQDVIRYEHPPWLKLTGYGKAYMTTLDKVQTLYPTRVVERVCAAYDVAPQARCTIEFRYIGMRTGVKIYEEFTFNEASEITFIEAWSDTPEVATQVQDETLFRYSQNLYDADLIERLKHPVYYWFRELLGWFTP